MLKLKVCRFGNSLGVILPREVIRHLPTEEGERLILIEAADCEYWLTPSDPAFRKKMTKVEQVLARYRNTLRSLAR